MVKDLASRLGALPVGQAGHFAGVSELGPPGDRTRPRRNDALEERIIQREHLIFPGLIHEESLQLFQLVGILCGEIVILGEVIGDVIEFPFVASHDIRHFGRAQKPRGLRRNRRGDPAIVVERTVTEHLEVLRLALRGSVRVGSQRCKPCSRLRSVSGRCHPPSPVLECQRLRESSATMSMMWWNCVRMPPTSLMWPGQEMHHALPGATEE